MMRRAVFTFNNEESSLRNFLGVENLNGFEVTRFDPSTIVFSSTSAAAAAAVVVADADAAVAVHVCREHTTYFT